MWADNFNKFLSSFKVRNEYKNGTVVIYIQKKGKSLYSKLEKEFKLSIKE